MNTFSQITLLSWLFWNNSDLQKSYKDSRNVPMYHTTQLPYVLIYCITMIHLSRLKILTLTKLQTLDKFTSFYINDHLETFGWCLSLVLENYQSAYFKILTVLHYPFLLTSFWYFLCLSLYVAFWAISSSLSSNFLILSSAVSVCCKAHPPSFCCIFLYLFNLLKDLFGTFSKIFGSSLPFFIPTCIFHACFHFLKYSNILIIYCITNCLKT